MVGRKTGSIETGQRTTSLRDVTRRWFDAEHVEERAMQMAKLEEAGMPHVTAGLEPSPGMPARTVGMRWAV